MYSYMYNLCICWRIFYFLLDLLNMVLYRYFSNGPFIPNPAVMDVTAGIIQKYMDPVQVCVDIIGQLLRQITAKAATKVQCVTAHTPSKYSASPLSYVFQSTIRHHSPTTKNNASPLSCHQSTVRHRFHTPKYGASPLSYPKVQCATALMPPAAHLVVGRNDSVALFTVGRLPEAAPRRATRH